MVASNIMIENNVDKFKGLVNICLNFKVIIWNQYKSDKDT